MLERQADDPDGDGGEDEQPCHALVGVFDAAMPDRAEQAADDPGPVLAKEDQQRDGGRDVETDKEREIERFVGRLSGDCLLYTSDAADE